MYLEVSPHCKFAPFHLCIFIPWSRSIWSCSHLFQSALKCFTVFPIAEQFLFCWYLDGRLFKFKYGWSCAFCGLLPRILFSWWWHLGIIWDRLVGWHCMCSTGKSLWGMGFLFRTFDDRLLTFPLLPYI